MKKLLCVLLSVLISGILLCTSILPAYAVSPAEGENSTVLNASSGISPRLTNCSGATFSFGVTSSGDATFVVTYEGRAASFSYAKLTVQVQKKFLGLFWRDVDEWTGYCYDVSGRFYDSVPADGTGTYRALLTLEVYGTTGVTDVIEDTIDCKYS